MPKRTRTGVTIPYKRKSTKRNVPTFMPVSRARISSRYRRGVGVHRFSRMATSTTTLVIAGGTSATTGTWTYALDQTAGYSEFTNLFDQYRLERVVVMLKLHVNPNAFVATDQTASSSSATPVPGIASVSYPSIYLVNDHDDSNSETLATMKQRAKLKRFILMPNKIVKWSVRPSLLVQNYVSAVSTSYSPKFHTWVDCGYASTPHYGTKWCLDYDGATVPANGNITVNVEFKYYFSCKDVR